MSFSDMEILRIGLDTTRSLNPILDRIDGARVQSAHDSLVETAKEGDPHFKRALRWDAFDEGLRATNAAVEEGLLEFISKPCGWLIPVGDKWEFSITCRETEYEAIPVYVSPTTCHRPTYVEQPKSWFRKLFGLPARVKRDTLFETYAEAKPLVKGNR